MNGGEEPRGISVVPWAPRVRQSEEEWRDSVRNGTLLQGQIMLIITIKFSRELEVGKEGAKRDQGTKGQKASIEDRWAEMAPTSIPTFRLRESESSAL